MSFQTTQRQFSSHLGLYNYAPRCAVVCVTALLAAFAAGIELLDDTVWSTPMAARSREAFDPNALPQS